MKQGHISYCPEGRLGNALWQASAAMGYAYDHAMDFSMPTTSRDPKWCPTYLPHLADPTFDPSLPTITIEERGYPFQKLPWDDRWRDGHNIVLNGFFQSEKYWAHHRERVLAAFGFPWEMRAGFCAVHIRRGDYLRWIDKHPAVPKEWYLAQMSKFPNAIFVFFSDDIDWAVENFGIGSGCDYAMDSHFYCIWDDIVDELTDNRPEVRDLVAMSQCEHLIGSASTMSVWAGILNRNPNARKIIPRQWICEGWAETTEKDWSDVCPVGNGWERA